MPILLRCGCGAQLRARDEYAGAHAKCGACGRVLLVPGQKAEAIPLADVREPAPDSTEPSIVSRSLAVGSKVSRVEGGYGVAEAPERLTRVPEAAPEPLLKRIIARRIAAPQKNRRDYLYWVLAVALVPLVFTLVFPHDRTPVIEKLRRALKEHPQVARRDTRAPKFDRPSKMPISSRSQRGGLPQRPALPEINEESRPDDTRHAENPAWHKHAGDGGEGETDDPEYEPDPIFMIRDLDEVFDELPGGRLEGAHLARHTLAHWAYAAGAATCFLFIILIIFPPGNASPTGLVLTGAFTATIGVCFLLIVQLLALVAQMIPIQPGSVLVRHSFFDLLFYILHFIGFSYMSALDPSSNFIKSFLGFTLGVGLLEEGVKAIPLIIYFRRREVEHWQGACLWGLATGVGFGVSEAVCYSASFYNGIEPWSTYLVRFTSCVALHAVWTGGLAISLMRNKDRILASQNFLQLVTGLGRVFSVPILLHGLYDTLLKSEMESLALVVALASFGWLAYMIEKVRGVEDAPMAEFDESASC